MLRKVRDGDTVPKLSFAQVLEVRRMLASGSTKAEVCEKFGVCPSTVQDIETAPRDQSARFVRNSQIPQ
jgi:hypothetical protein